MKKHLFLFVSLLLTACFCLSACGKNAARPNDAAADTPDASASPAPTRRPYTPADPDFNPDTDADNRFASENGSLIETDGGFYWYSCESDYLLFYDYGLEEMLPVCPKPECEHFGDGNVLTYNAGCSAFIRAARNPALYQGKLWYVVPFGGKPNPYAPGTSGQALYRMDPDGTNREFVMDIFTPDGSAPQWSILHRGLLYCLVWNNTVENGEPKSVIGVAVTPIDKPESKFKTIYKAEHPGWGKMQFYLDYCYFELWFTKPGVTEDGSVDYDATVHEYVIGRWNSVTEETEILFEEDFTDGRRIGQLFVDNSGEVYAADQNSFLRYENGRFEEVFSTEDPDYDFSIWHISDGIVFIEENNDDEENLKDPRELIWWIRKFDGTTLYRGPLPLDWIAEDTSAPLFGGYDFTAGDETGFYVELSGESRVTGKRICYLARYDFTGDGGLDIKILGSFYSQFVDDLN